MKNTVKFFMLGMLVFITMVAGCKKISLEDRSKITITGNTFGDIDLNRTYEVDEGDYAGPYGTLCGNLIFETTVVFLLEPTASLTLRLMQLSDNEPVPEGTYYVSDTDCKAGVIALLTVPSSRKAVYNLEISSGTMKVKDDEGTYDINFDFIISPISGGGKLTGNFTGTMGQLTVR